MQDTRRTVKVSLICGLECGLIPAVQTITTKFQCQAHLDVSNFTVLTQR